MLCPQQWAARSRAVATTMIETHNHLAYAPRGAGLLYAVLWFEAGRDVYGWYIGSRDGVAEASYFMLPGYHSAKSGTLYRSLEDDLYGPWAEVTGRKEAVLAHPPPVPQALCHELARLQDDFVRQWLFFDDDPRSDGEQQALNAMGLPVCHVNIRAAKLRKLQPSAVVWRYDAPGADLNVLTLLSRHWPLDERLAA